ncbi:MAG: sel1 repeat family protein [Proteobacteria bacterium]|nr:sel1 repeat family protein [Pseudomonadota bacterium]
MKPYRSRQSALAILALAGTLVGAAARADNRGDLLKALAQFDHGDYAHAIIGLKPLAAHGDVSAQYAMGLSDYTPLGAPRNLPDALHWFRLAAAQGLPQAQFSLGVMYARGEGVRANQSAAVQWFKAAASSGYAPAYFNLGVHFAQGEGAYPDLNVALAYMMVAADLGQAEAVEKRDELAQFVGATRTAAARRAADRMKAAIVHVAAPPLPGDSAPTSAATDAASSKPSTHIRIHD